MIIGIGIDIVSISRVSEACKKPRFLARVFSESENIYFKSKKIAAQTIAANFAAKEAFSKALGTGMRGFALAHIEVLRDDLGKPYIFFGDRFKHIARTHVTISHDGDNAVAMVVLEGV